MKKEERLEPWSLPFRRSLQKGIGYTEEQLQRPLIGVVNGWGENNPAAGHLGSLAGRVKAGIEAAGGTPMEFAISSLCGGIAGGSRGSSYSLAYRDVVADFVEIITEVNMFDALVFTTVCDDVVPAHLMAAGRLNLPSIIVLGGYMAPGSFKGRSCHAIEVGTGYGELKRGNMTEEDFSLLVDSACGSHGACPVMGTGNTMGVIAETLGMTLPGNSTLCGTDPQLFRMAYQAGKQILSLWKKQVLPSQIMTLKSFENAIRILMAVGGSTNALLHIPAIAGELGIDIPLTLFDKLSRETPFICNVKPSGKFTLRELQEAGGLPALLGELAPLLNRDCLTVNEATLADNIRDSVVLNRQMIAPLKEPLSPEGGLAILGGTLAPKGAVIKISGLPDKEKLRKGPARVFDSEREACEKLLEGVIQPGDFVVIRYVGPKGDPGMRITARFLWLLSGMSLDGSITLISDGRFSGTNKGGAIGHVSPEAASCGPIALVENGDLIQLDIPNRKVDLLVPEEELERRGAFWKPQKSPFTKGLLGRIASSMMPVEEGAVLRRDFSEN